MAEFEIWESSKFTHKREKIGPIQNQQGELKIHNEFRTYPLLMQKLYVFMFEIRAFCLKQVGRFELSLFQKLPCISMSFKWSKTISNSTCQFQTQLSSMTNLLQVCITFSFQLQYAHSLKHWILNSKALKRYIACQKWNLGSAPNVTSNLECMLPPNFEFQISMQT